MRSNRRQPDPPEDDQSSNKSLHRFNFDKFDEETEEWKFYIQRFEIALARHDVPEDDALQGILLLSSVVPMVFRMLAERFYPKQVNTIGYTQLKECLGSFYTTNELVFANRRTFHTRFRHEGEPLRVYFKELRSIASICQFGKCLQEHLRDQMVIGINNDSWQEELIRKFPSNNTTLADVEQAALLMEQISDQQSKLKELSTVQTNKVGKPILQRNYRTDENPVELKRGVHCFRCGFKLHKNIGDCPAKDKDCKACGKRGHFSKACFSKKRALINQTTNRRGSISSSSESIDDPFANAYTLKQRGTRAMLDVKINGVQIAMLMILEHLKL